MIDSTAGAGTTTNDAGEPKMTDATAVDTTTATTSEQQPGTQATPEVPDSYEFTMPEGVEVDKTAAEEFATIAKELKLSKEDAQKVADVGAKMAQRQAESHARLVETWVEQVKTDKELGGDKLEENLAVARKAIEAFGTPELKDVLNSTGFGNHPAVIRAFYNAGKAISQDGYVKGAPKGASDDPAKRMFPNMN